MLVRINQRRRKEHFAMVIRNSTHLMNLHIVGSWVPDNQQLQMEVKDKGSKLKSSLHLTKTQERIHHQNLEATRKRVQDSKCKLCQKSNTENIRCEWCKSSQCSSLQSDLHKLTSQASSHLHWYCLSCKGHALKAIRNDQETEDRCNAFMESFKQ